jgi:hypothetical protein
MRGVVLDGRQQHHPPGTKVSVAGHKAGRVEPEDSGQAWESADSCAEELGWAFVWVDVDRELDVQCLREQKEPCAKAAMHAGFRAGFILAYPLRSAYAQRQ